MSEYTKAHCSVCGRLYSHESGCAPICQSSRCEQIYEEENQEPPEPTPPGNSKGQHGCPNTSLLVGGVPGATSFPSAHVPAEPAGLSGETEALVSSRAATVGEAREGTSSRPDLIESDSRGGRRIISRPAAVTLPDKQQTTKEQ